MKDPFSFWQKNGRLRYHKDEVRIYSVGADDYLFVGQTLYASTTERPWYVRNLLPWVKGSVLEIGLGLGCASRVILAKHNVKSLLTIEKNQDVIEAFGRPLPRHLILLTDVYDWASRMPKGFAIYDFIFVDHYTATEEEDLEKLTDLSKNLVPLLKKGGRMVFWVDENALDEDRKKIKDLWLINGD